MLQRTAITYTTSLVAWRCKMDFRKYLKTKNFKLKAKELEFGDVKWMSKSEKMKVYKDMIKLLNNHFKQTTFSKRLYEHLYINCGFIAHYNQYGFYCEYFSVPANFHEKEADIDEVKSGELFYDIAINVQTKGSDLNAFFTTVFENKNWGGYADYKDLDDAIKESLNEYIAAWREIIAEAKEKYAEFIKREDVKKLKEEEAKIKEQQKILAKKLLENEQRIRESAEKIKSALSLLDFMDVA